MKSRQFIILCVVTVLVVIGALLASRQHAPATGAEKPRLFSELGGQLNDITAIKLSGKGRSVTLNKRDKQWVIADADGYPAKFTAVKQLLVGVSELRVLAEKTGNPEKFARLGVEEPNVKDSNAVLLSLYTGTDTGLLSLIVGNNRRSKSPSDRPGLYVRLPHKNRALLVAGKLDASTEIVDWFERDLFDITAARVRDIQITPGDGAVVHLQRREQAADLELLTIPKGKEAQSSVVISRMGTLLENMFVDNVRSNAKVTMPDDAVVTVVRTFDGLVTTVTSAEVDGVKLSHFEFSVDPDQVAAAAEKAAAKAAAESSKEEDAESAADKGDTDTGEEAAATSDEPAAEDKDVHQEAEKLNARLNDWVYELPDYKFELLVKPLDELVREPEDDKEGVKQPD